MNIKEILKPDADSAKNDSWYLPVDLEARITAALETARAEGWKAAVEATAKVAEDYGTIGGDGYPVEPEAFVDGAREFVAPAIRALSTAKAEAAKAD